MSQCILQSPPSGRIRQKKVATWYTHLVTGVRVGWCYLMRRGHKSVTWIP
jgi:hypothetical protein